MTAPPVAWRPDADLLRGSNVARFMVEHDLADFDELVRRSIDEPEWFWAAVVDFLAIPFDGSFTHVLDTSAGIPWAKWFTGATCNVARTCVDALPSDHL